MCGLLGVVGERLVGHVRREWATFSRVLAHRGPDDFGTLEVRSPPALFLHWRLAVLDLSARSRQPFATPDGRLHLLYNGEIYNYVELRRELERAGRRFTTTGDTEVLLAAWQKWGESALGRLVGMFAFAMVDQAAGTLTLVRDPFGIKPLYWAAPGGEFAFASEIKALLPLPGVQRDAEPRRVRGYLLDGLTDDGEETFLRGIRQLPAGHVMSIPLDRAAPAAAPAARRWFRLQPVRFQGSLDEAAAMIRDQFLDSVALHLRSDVRVGTALSGGIDSSAVVMSMRRLQGNTIDLHCFSHVTDDPAINEERWADLVGDAAGAMVHKAKPTARELLADLDALIRAQDEPFVTTSIYAQYRVYKLAAAHGLKVMLDGQGGDELFAGYRHFLAARMATLVRGGRGLSAARMGVGFLRASGPAGLRHLPKAGRLLARRLGRGGSSDPPWLEPAWFAAHGAGPAAPERTPDDGKGGRLHAALRDAIERQSLPALLRFQDRNSMAFSVEARVPFLTVGLAETALGLPEEYLVGPDATTKCVLRRALRGIVPERVLDRRDKIGFETPQRQWLAELRPALEGILGGETARTIPALRHESMMAALDNDRAGVAGPAWRWLNLVRWAELLNVRFEPAPRHG